MSYYTKLKTELEVSGRTIKLVEIKNSNGFELIFIDEVDGSLFVSGNGDDKEEAAQRLTEALIERKII